MVHIKYETILFKNVTLRDILDHLGATSTGGEAINVTILQQGMSSWWVEDPRVPEFVTCCKDAHWKDRRAGLAISDAWLVALTSRSLLAEKSFPDKQPKFEGFPQLNWTWENWKPHFQDVQEAPKRVMRHSNPSVDSFLSTNSAASIHGISYNSDTLHPSAS